jgi:uncharacterized protein YraI
MARKTAMQIQFQRCEVLAAKNRCNLSGVCVRSAPSTNYSAVAQVANPSTTAISVVAISRVRTRKRHGSQIAAAKAEQTSERSEMFDIADDLRKQSGVNSVSGCLIG